MSSTIQIVEAKIKALAEKYTQNLKSKIDVRAKEMQEDDKTHHLIYQVLGVSTKEGEMIDFYQNKGRFLYNYAGSFLEEATILCFESKFPNAERKIKIPNTITKRPKTFEIDCLVGQEAFEIKWRDATTDGDHITKEHTRAQAIKNHGYHPVRVMFYYPNRSQAIKIQATLQTLYAGMDGEYYASDQAWRYVKQKTGIDLLRLLQKIADEKE